jgi:predicted Zn-dependent protease
MGERCVYVKDLALLVLMLPRLGAEQQHRAEKILKLSRKGKGRGLLVLLLVGLMLLGASGWGFWLLVLYGRDSAISKIPVSWEQQLGKQAYEGMLKDTPVCKSPVLKAGIAKLEARLESSLKNSPYHLEYQVLKSDQVNAFALPGGHIGLNAALISKAPSPEALMGVMAHEAQHVLGRHGLKGIINQFGIMLLVPLIFGDMGSVMLALGGMGASLINLGFSRSQESEADAKGLELLAQSQVNPQGMESFFSWMASEEAKKGAPPAFLSSHPLSSERRDSIHQSLTRLPKKTWKPLAINWLALQSEAKKCLSE